jgi:hypothetical protein
LIGHCRGWPALLIACVGLGAFTPARAADALAHASLAGVDSVSVRVFTHGKWPPAWPDAAHLEASVAVRLKETGVPVSDWTRDRGDTNAARLAVRIDVLRPPAHRNVAGVPFRCEVSLERRAKSRVLAPDPHGAGATSRFIVWTAHVVSFEAADAGPEELFETLDEEVDAFASDWLAAHAPK